MYDFKDKQVWISGAGRGIGRACAIGFAKMGAKVHLVARTESELIKTAKDCGAGATYEVLDVTDEAAVEKSFQALGPLDVAVNNAGFEGKWAGISELSSKDFDEVMNVNVRSLWTCLKFQTLNMRQHKLKGAIVNIASVAGLVAFPDETPYITAKHGAIGLTRAIALEQIRHGIRVNSVAPGSVDTEMLRRHLNPEEIGPSYPIGRVAQPSEIADAVIYLASEKASYIVGHTLVVDGGYTISGL